MIQVRIGQEEKEFISYIEKALSKEEYIAFWICLTVAGYPMTDFKTWRGLFYFSGRFAHDVNLYLSTDE